MTARHASVHDRRARPRGSRRGRGLVIGAVVVVLLAAGVTGAYAYWTDTPTVQSGSLTSGKVATQNAPTCASVVLTSNIRLTWTQVHPRNEYAWELRNASTNALVTSGTVGGGTAVGQNVTLDITPAMAASNAVFNVVVRARLTSPTAWVAATSTSTPVRRQTVILNTMYCGAS